MKDLKLLFLPLLFITLSGINKSYAIPAARPEPIPELIQNLKVSELVKLSAKQFAMLTGKKMGLLARLKFNFIKMKLRHDLKKDPNLLLKDYAKAGKKKLGTGWIILIIVGSVIFLSLLILLLAMGGWGKGQH